MTIATCLGGGGVFGTAYNMGVATALQDAGFALETGPLLGTSAGSWSAAMIATGRTIEDIRPVWELAHPRRRFPAGKFARAVFGNEMDPLVASVAVPLVPGFARRVVLSGAQHRLADIVAASSSIPLVSPAHVIDGKRYVDGGVISGASVDLTPGADTLVVIVPIAGPVLGPFGRMGDLMARTEIARWKRRHGGRVLYIAPDARFTPFARLLRGPFDDSNADEIFAAAYDLGRERAVEFSIDRTLLGVA